MKATVYELLGKVKDTTKTNIYVKYFNRINQKKDKMLACKENIIYKLDQCIIELNDEVEILDEEDGFIDIDTINICREEQSELAEKINEIIKNQKKIIERLDKNE